MELTLLQLTLLQLLLLQLSRCIFVVATRIAATQLLFLLYSSSLIFMTVLFLNNLVLILYFQSSLNV
jgi:hypothetical protein